MARVAHILSELSEDDVDWMLASGERRAVSAGTALMREGVPGDALFVVLEGTFTIASVGRREEVARLGRGDMIGEISLVDSRPASATVTALTDGIVFALPRDAVAARLELDAGFSARPGASAHSRTSRSPRRATRLPSSSGMSS